MKLSTATYMEGYFFKPRADPALLTQYHEGLICLTGCSPDARPACWRRQ